MGLAKMHFNYCIITHIVENYSERERMQKGLKKIATGAISAVGSLGLAAMPVMAADTPAAVTSVSVTPPAWAIDGDLSKLITSILNITFGIGVILALAYLIWGAFSWITSGGEKTKTGEARNKIVAAVVGLVLLAAAWGILTIVLRILGTDIQSATTFSL
jgi:hypothetical protein